MKSYGRLPLSFEANHGQTDGKVKFLSRGSGYNLFLSATEAVLSLRKPRSEDKAGKEPALHKGSLKNNLVEFAPEFAVDLIDLIEQNRRNSELF